MNKKTVSTIMLILLLTGVFTFSIFPFALSNSTAGIQGYAAIFQGESTLVSGYISENTTWTLEDSPYIIVGDVVVESGAFLTVEPGVSVKFTSEKSLVIDGGLVAQGNETHKITFTSNSTTPAPGDYMGIKIRSSAECAPFDHCIAE